MKAKRPSIKDIAAALNVSVTTVSFVLNGKAKEMRISEEVTQKILDYASKINYTPNLLAQSLRTGKTNIIVFMVEDISNPFFAKLARIIEIIAYQEGYKVIFCSNENQDDKTKELINIFLDRKVDGYIIIPSPGSERKIKSLMDMGIPVVLFDRYFPGLEANMVVINNEESSFNATQHLIENNFREIAFVTIEAPQTQMQDRLRGYSRAVNAAGLTENILLLPYREKEKTDLKKKLVTYLNDHPQVDAIFFSTNYLTQRGLLILKEEFPDKINELGLLTFDDNTFFEIFSPSITAVAQPLEEIGTKLMEVMLNLLDKSDSPSLKKLVLSAELIKRDSSKAKIAIESK